ncbi:hypothetical protein L6164_002784 [Bauhinia variegata]|uniref:Uncharacterized protein n=1 Tax=Bauhinia variegata TaxID=167791 RepID=A0ACB9PZ92_BAUVA|nr:hypothetical protein L6164_002784 [Bauhinia variegata]
MEIEQMVPDPSLNNARRYGMQHLSTVVTVKLMTDASVEEYGLGITGGVLCDANGAFLAAWANKISNPVSAPVLEAVSIREAMLLIQLWGYYRINIEGDGLEVMTYLQRRWQIQSSLGAVTDYILERASSFSICNFKWIPRQENHMAHTLANYGHRVNTLLCWMDPPPMCFWDAFAALSL